MVYKKRRSNVYRMNKVRRLRYYRYGVPRTVNPLNLRHDRGVSMSRVKNVLITMPAGMPASIVTKMKYNQSFLMSPPNSATGYDIANFRHNGPYDPKASSGGSFPYYWTNYQGLYDRYVCFGSKIKVAFISQDTTIPLQTLVIGIVPFLQSTTLSTDVTVLNEMPGCKHKFTQLNDASIVPVLTSYASASSLFGVSKRKIADDDQYGAVTAPALGQRGVPAIESFWGVYCGYAGGSTPGAIGKVLIDVSITYYVKFYQRVEVTAPGSVSPDGPTGPTGPN